MSTVFFTVNLLPSIMMYFTKSFTILLIFLVTMIKPLGFAQHLIKHDRQFYKMADMVLVGDLTSTRKVKDIFECVFHCLEHGPSACLSFNIAKTSRDGFYSCELSDSERCLDPQRMQGNPSFDYFGTSAEVSF